jgi:hypothetical protein
MMLSESGHQYSLSIEEYREEMRKATALEDKFNLLRSQFLQDPFQFDMGHNSTNLSIS